MMTKEQHIDYWINTAAEDWITVETLFGSGRYIHSLFWAHLVLEKLAKALWVKNNTDDIPPKIHNIVFLLQDSNIDLGNDKTAFLAKFNRYQASSRYPDYSDKIYQSCTKEVTEQELEKVKEVRTCLLKMLP